VLVPQGDQAAQVDRDVVGLADVQRQGGAVQALAQEVAAQERGGPAGARDDLEDPVQDLVLELGQRLGDRRGVLGLTRSAADQAVWDDRVAAAVRAVLGGEAGDVCGVEDAGADAVVADAQRDQLLHRAGINIAGHDRDDHRVAGDGPGRLALQPGAAVAGGHRGGGAVGGPPRAVLADHWSCSTPSRSISRSSAK
jgi:hypothetical protein